MSDFTRDDAVEHLHALGFGARKRDWNFGETVVAGANVSLNAGVEVWGKSVCIFPSKGQWLVQVLGNPYKAPATYQSLQVATFEAAKLLSS